MSGPRKHDYLSIIGKLHEEYFGSEEEQRIAKMLAEERATANADLAYRFANLAMPEDIRSRSKAWGMEAFCETLWNNAFQAGFREAARTPDPAQIRADALREALEIANKAVAKRIEQIEEERKNPAQEIDVHQIMRWGAGKVQAELIADEILALITTPLSPPAVDTSPAPDAGGKEDK